MLSELSVTNFKAFKETTSIHLKAVTVLSGPNSSGKTALLQSLLLLSQTLSSRVTTRPLVLNGEYVKIGMWDDVPHSDCPNEATTFKISLDLPIRYPRLTEQGRRLIRRTSIARRAALEGFNKLDLQVSFDRGRGAMKLTPPPVIKEITIGAKKVRTDGKSKEVKLPEYSISIKRRGKRLVAGKYDELSAMLPEMIEKDVLEYTVTEIMKNIPTRATSESEFLEGPRKDEPIIGSTFRHFLPSKLIRQFDITSRQLREDIIALLGRELYVKSRFSAKRDLEILMKETMFQGSTILPKALIKNINEYLDFLEVKTTFEGSTVKEFVKFISSLPKYMRSQSKQAQLISRVLPYVLYSVLDAQLSDDVRKNSIGIRPLSAIARSSTEIIEDFFANHIRYLGPLRDDPRVIYALPPSPDIPDVGIKGQYTAVVLDHNKDIKIIYIDPIKGTRRQATLQEATCIWLQHMGMLKSVSTKEEGKLGYKLTVRMHDLERELDLTTVGVGVSQVLPILVMSLLAPPGTLLIFEQPEIHLHPKVQSLLGDFFLSMGQLGKQCLIETHSEYLVNKLRQLIVKAKDDSVLNLVQTYFVERIGNVSNLREIETNEYGAIVNWPEGYFDEGILQAESIMRLSAEKQMMKHQSTANENTD